MVLTLHRFLIAFSRVVVNHVDGGDGPAPDPLVWSAGTLPKRRRLVLAVRDRAFFAWTRGYLGWLLLFAPVSVDDVGTWPYSVGMLV